MRLYDSKKKIVYFILGKKAVQYNYGRRSRILYIGKTERAGSRPFESLRENAPDLLSRYGIKSLSVVYIEATGRQKVDIAGKLERICLHEFRGWFGKVPLANKQGGKRLELTDEEDYINAHRIRDILQVFS
jgi:hypothetical protein